MSTLYCCGCGADVTVRLTDGAEIYPHRADLADTPFWKCDACNNFVGCHHKSDDPTRPLGCIPTPQLRAARKQIHALLDPLWKSGRMRRSEVYAALSKVLGWEYHTAKLRSLEDVQNVKRILLWMGVRR